MQIVVDDRFRKEADELDLRFTCESCVCFLAATEACAHEWPNEVHRKPPDTTATTVVFCKEFELR